ncbi:uncharacterized protein LOC128265730 [Drosophila gunungcola]|uniref:Single domain-containing protein n=1 Tax=Drosophila gunungcola TaxID=103775 RepID=A0A9P9YAC4_9MUSC|nr:uncharacterized protein LOC128265730 [Drosophila gunungcola]KAI8033312.1 hypothetical protein M5D96_013916 [Drosophila gunungcola]
MSTERNSSPLIPLAIAGTLLSILFAQVSGYSGLIPPDAANPGKCIYRGDILELGVNNNNGISPCQRLTCHKDGSILIEGCGKLRIENCNRGERISPGEPFPECCKLRYKCKEIGAAPYYIERNAAEKV